MTVIAGTVSSVHGHTTPNGPKKTSANKDVYFCFIHCDFTGTYVQNDDANVLLVTTAIANSRRDGKTIALLDACFAAPGDEAGTAIGAKTVAVSSTGLTLELTGADMSTEHAGALLGTLSDPIAFGITYTAV